MDGGKSYENIRLIIAPEVQKLLDDRLILVEDIQQVIEYAERSGKKLLNKKTGRFLAYYKPAAVTYWVEYLPQGEAFVVYNAYSHRMEIGEENFNERIHIPCDLDTWECALAVCRCVIGKIQISYLGSAYPVDLLKCPSCGLVFIPEELALGKMAEVEKALEDK